MEDSYIIAIDIGTSSTKCAALAKGSYQIAASASYEYATHYPYKHWIEQNPEDWWTAVQKGLNTLCTKIDAEKVEAIGLSGNMSALVYLDKNFQVLRNSMMVADTRSEIITNRLRETRKADLEERTGNSPIEAFSLPKLLWLQEYEPEILAKTAYIMSPKDFIRFRLTGELKSDRTDAGNTMLYNIHDQQWDRGLMEDFHIDPEKFLPLVSSMEEGGRISAAVAEAMRVKEGTPVAVGGADIACSQAGTGSIQQGVLQVTLSSSAQIVVSLKEVDARLYGKVTHHPSVVGGEVYAMGTVFSGGFGAEWGYKLIYGSEDSTRIDKKRMTAIEKEIQDVPPGSNGLIFLPFLTGSGSPHFQSYENGTFLGLRASHTKAEMFHAVLEGISFHIYESIELYQSIDIPIETIVIGAGGSNNRAWCQMISNICNLPVGKLGNHDASPLGAALLASVTAGWFDDIVTASRTVVKTTEKYHPELVKTEKYRNLYGKYKEAALTLRELYKKWA
ncbi:xylulokinase [Alkalicoccus daliensis]|uniref:Xylulokinase n=1 Tax=Alkalicoccus daliensis TaxID=745820 RepID=A0A1H0GDE0_9BACI|nr:FGGY family carbohydrate kinase [Alkalicoccus daliensis]SDO04945.1 xylulokinase [Alkalicoccus daliensis]